MSQLIQTNKPKVTPNGTYYSGMTEDEAKTKKVYNKNFGLDFQDIDTDKDKVLSVFEIKEACKKQAKRTKITGFTEIAAGATLSFVGCVSDAITFGATTTLILTGVSMITDGVMRLVETDLTPEGCLGLRATMKEDIKNIFSKDK